MGEPLVPSDKVMEWRRKWHGRSYSGLHPWDERQDGLGRGKNTETIGSVYFIQSVLGGPIKIGFSTEVHGRLGWLQTAHAAELRILGQIDQATYKTEGELHRQFSALRVAGEWFHPGLALVEWLAERGIEAKASETCAGCHAYAVVSEELSRTRAELSELRMARVDLLDDLALVHRLIRRQEPALLKKIHSLFEKALTTFQDGRRFSPSQSDCNQKSDEGTERASDGDGIGNDDGLIERTS